MYELASSLADASDPYVRLGQAEAVVRAYCNWHIAPSRTETVLVPASHSHILVLPTLNVSAITSVTVEGSVIDPTDYSWSARGVITRTCGSWWSTNATDVSVVLTHGYSTVPLEVEAVVQAVAQRAVNNPGSVLRDQAGPFSVSYSTVGANQAPTIALMDAEKSILDRYRLPPLA